MHGEEDDESQDVAEEAEGVDGGAADAINHELEVVASIEAAATPRRRPIPSGGVAGFRAGVEEGVDEGIAAARVLLRYIHGFRSRDPFRR